MNLSKGVGLIPFLFPINVYLIGDTIGVGLQFLVVRVQQTYMGWSVIPLWREAGFVVGGIFSIRTSLSVLLWLGGVLLLVAAAILLISNRGTRRWGMSMYWVGCVLLVLSTMVQYSLLFYGPSGISVPVGLPALVAIGYVLSMETGDADMIWDPEDDQEFDPMFIEESVPTASTAAGADD